MARVRYKPKPVSARLGVSFLYACEVLSKGSIETRLPPLSALLRSFFPLFMQNRTPIQVINCKHRDFHDTKNSSMTVLHFSNSSSSK